MIKCREAKNPEFIFKDSSYISHPWTKTVGTIQNLVVCFNKLLNIKKVNHIKTQVGARVQICPFLLGPISFYVSTWLCTGQTYKLQCM
jgi:hypothetical protein